MQNRYHQITSYWSILVIFCCLPIVLCGVSSILPTFDDFTTLQSPQFTSPWSKQLLPNDSFWRPWDYLFGCLLGRNITLFPTLNHIIIILGHTINALLVFIICKKLKFSTHALNFATLFFFFSPASLGTTLAVDGLNQTYAQLWGLAALFVYLKDSKKYWFWSVFIFIGALAKENGLAWAVIPPIIAYAFNLIQRKQALHDCGIGIVIAIVYFAARITLNVSGEITSDYLDGDFISHVKDLVQLIIYNCIPVDFISIVYPPSRNWLLAAVTFILSLPFLIILCANGLKLLKKKTLPLLILCFFILASPHLLTLVSIMHNYAPLSMTSIIVAYILSNINKDKMRLTTITFVVYIMTAIFTDIHHFIYAQKSGYLSRDMAQQTIVKTGRKTKSVYVISIDDHTPKYSSFCVPPVEAFAWGLSVRFYNDFEWPKEITDTLIDISEKEQVTIIANQALSKGADCVWIVNNKNVDIKK